MTRKFFLKEVNKTNSSFHHIRSFVCRQGRLTKGQRYALEHYWSTIGIEFKEKFLDFFVLFGRDAPIVLEIGFGMGASLVTMAQSSPEKNFIGIEVYLPGVGACLASSYKKGIKNLRIICYDAVDVLYSMIPNVSIHIVQLFFPDPWCKTRYNKRRIVQLPFAELVKSKLKLGGIFHVVTDWEPYAKHILKVMSSFQDYQNQSESNDYTLYSMCRPVTKFEQRANYLGHNVWDLRFKKIK